jgi:hypothetical protein
MRASVRQAARRGQSISTVAKFSLSTRYAETSANRSPTRPPQLTAPQSPSTPPVEQTKERRSYDEHQPIRGLGHWVRRRIERVQRVRSHQEYFLAVLKAVPVGIWVEGVGSDGLLLRVGLKRG